MYSIITIKGVEEAMCKEYITVGKAAEMLGVTPQTLRNWEKKGMLMPSYRTETGLRCYSEQQLLEYMSKHNTGGHYVGENIIYVPSEDEESLRGLDLAERFAAGKGMSYIKKVGEYGIKSVLSEVLEHKVKNIIIPSKKLYNIADFWYLDIVFSKLNVNIIYVDNT